MIKRSRLMLIALLISLIYVTACSNPASLQGSDGKNQDNKKKLKTAGTTFDYNMQAELNFFTNGRNYTDEDFKEMYSDPVKKKFPNVKINYLKRGKGSSLPELISAGTQIDILFDSIKSTVEGYIANGMTYDISELVKKHNVDLSRFEDAPTKAMREMAGGGLYGLPETTQKLVIYYNKELFDKFGIPYPKNGMTWDDITNLSKKMNRQENGIQYIGFAPSMGHALQLNSLSLPLVDPKSLRSTFSNEKWKEWIESVFINPTADSAYQNYLKSNKNSLPGRDDFFKNQTLAMTLQLSDQALLYTPEQLEAFNWDMVSVPVLKGQSDGFQDYPGYLLVTNTTKNKDLAVKVVDYLTSPEVLLDRARTKGRLSSLKDSSLKQALAESKVYKGKNVDAIFYYKSAPIAPVTIYQGAAQDLLNDAVKEAYSGAKDINTALREAEEKTNTAIDELKNK